MKHYFVPFICSIILFVACTPYNSTEKNKELMQGRWRLKEIYYLGSDSTYIPHDTVFLTFTGDTIMEEVNSDFQRKGLINIKRYTLEWLQSGEPSVNFQIVLLNDSIFSMRSIHYNNIWSLKKEKAV